MILSDDKFLGYCSNIHPGESWDAHFRELREYVPGIKAEVSPDGPLGLGLRLSKVASDALLAPGALQEFKDWLQDRGVFVFTLNGFPYGGFHGTRVKDAVYQPDWLSTKRLEYTQNLFGILQAILPEEEEGSLSTCPISYRYWHKPEDLPEALAFIAEQMAGLAWDLHRTEQESRHFLHLDLEPEPDGLLEDTPSVLHFFKEYLFRQGVQLLKKKGISGERSEEILRRHLQLCYDVCHYSLAFEDPSDTLNQMAAEGIGIGKVQISAALQADLSKGRDQIGKALQPFDESVYLHQVRARMPDGSIESFRDLGPALQALPRHPAEVWRCHYHVPVFLESFGVLDSTQDAIVSALQALRTHPGVRHYEVETYTWEVLPQDMRLDLGQSICRELRWVHDLWNQGEDT